MKYISVYIGSDDELNFFTRLSAAFRKKNYEFIFLSNKISIILKLWIRGYKTHLIRKCNLHDSIPDLSKCFELRIGFISLKEAEILYSAVHEGFRYLSLKYFPDYIFIWNGLSVQTIAASNYARSAGIKTRYFELANLPGKLFVNPVGVNAQSSLFNDINILKRYEVAESEYLDWKKGFEESLSSKYVQGKKYVNNYLFFLDLAAFYLLNIPKSGETNLIKKIKSIYFAKLEFEFDKYDLSEKRYVFLPLQVNYDTQLIYNSEIGNIEAIRLAHKRASELKADLVVKIHPAEFDNEFLREIIKIKSKMNFFLVNNYIYDLLRFALLVITINSTAGLIARILNKNVEYLGRSFYSLLDDQLLKNYILRYLLGTEYFSDQEIKETTADDIIEIE